MIKAIIFSNKTLKIISYLYVFIFLLSINKIFSEDNHNIINLLNSSDLNSVAIFNHKYWRAACASTNKNGDMIIEFALHPLRNRSRLFYGLNRDGRHYFPEEPFFKEIEEIQCDNCDTTYGKDFQLRNLFVSLNSDINNTKQYLLSMTSNNGSIELIDIENNFELFAWDAKYFFNLTLPIYSYEYSLFELEEYNNYISVFSMFEGDNNNIGDSNTVMITKFSFGTFNSDNGLKIKSDWINSAFNDRVVSAFQLDISKLIVVIYVTYNTPTSLYFKYYDENLETKGTNKFCEMYSLSQSYGIFFKGIPMKNDHFALSFFNDGGNGKSLSFQLRKYENFMNPYTLILSYNFSFYEFKEDVQTNGFFKLDDLRLVLFAVENNNGKYGIMHMFLIDFYYEYSGMKIREFLFYSPENKLSKEKFAYNYNGYLLISLTLENNANPSILFSIAMIFGFANGTDFSIDISPFLMDLDNYNGKNNLYNYLSETMNIENNIFKYEKIEKIKLISICDELLLYKGKIKFHTEESLISINESFDENYTLFQNKNKIKNAQFYGLEYQFMIKEPDYETFYSIPNSTFNNPKNFDASQYYEPKTFYGRINILKFKLCHKYCLNCKEYGIDDNNQKCLTCKEEYSYDYLSYIGNFTGNCVPYDQMYDVENKILIYCNSTNYKYYYNTSRNNSRYCFKYDYDCPYPYNEFNEATKECFNYLPTTNIKTTSNTFLSSLTISTNLAIPTTSKTTIPFIHTTFPEIIPTTFQEQCKFGALINYISYYSNLTNEEIYHIIKESIFSSYCINGSSVFVEGSNGSAFQISNTNEEIQILQDGTDDYAIDLNQCGNILKDVYNINQNESLIILKFLKIYKKAEKVTSKYEIYHPHTYQILNTSYCQNTTIDVYIPFTIDVKYEELYNELVSLGYNPLDLRDKFYIDICSPYTTENETDILLDDREEFIYNSLINVNKCPDGCDFSGFNYEKKQIKCECDNNDDAEIVKLDLKHLSRSNILKSFLSTLKSTNYLVIKCYKLVFNYKLFKYNYGSSITLIIICFYLIFLIFYVVKGITPIKLNVSKLLIEEKSRDKNSNLNLIRTDKNNPKKKGILKIGYHPPKKEPLRKKSLYKRNNLAGKKNYSFEIFKAKIIAPKKSIKKNIKPSSKRIINFKDKSGSSMFETSKKIHIRKNELNNEKKSLNNGIKKLDNFELNNLNYNEAYEIDKRSFLKTYWSVLMREHILLFTFFSCNDYNLIYIKLVKFLVMFCSDMALNGLFFVHESMHKKYTLGEDFTFVQKIPQLLLTLIVTKLLEVLLCFLSLTDNHFYQIKNLSNFKKEKKAIKTIFQCIKKKLICFFILTFFLLAFYWYFISSFCAVYKNTQKVFLKDTIISFMTSLLDPFIIYGFTTLLRFVSLSKCLKKNRFLGYIYRLSDAIPIF